MRDDGHKFLNKLVVTRFSSGEFNFVGRCIAYCDAPTVTLELPNGEQATWRADMSEVIEMHADILDKLLPLRRKD